MSDQQLPPGSLANRGPVTSRAAANRQLSGADTGTGEAKFRALKAELSAQGRLFEDPDFPAEQSSISKQQPARPLEWKRPKEICKDPNFFVGGASRFDVRQGELGDCWLLAAVASLSMHPQLFSLVVPQDQDFTDSDYCGLIRFRFWQFGEWTDVIVDDRLPTRGGRLVYMHSADKNEFWSALLEKAYAKTVGSYGALRSGLTCMAMEDFTGGITEFYNLRRLAKDNSLFRTMLRANRRSSLMGCSITELPNRSEDRRKTGLITGHAYSITDVRTVELSVEDAKKFNMQLVTADGEVDIDVQGETGRVALLRVRNPWGNESEWTGAWSDKSPEWKALSDAEKANMGLTFEKDGEFWMSFADFCANFQSLEICHLGPDSLWDKQLGDLGKNKRRWEAVTHRSAWRKHVNAGGCRNYISTFWTNPQFRVKVVDPDEDDDEKKGSIIVGLMQMNMRKRLAAGIKSYAIGYSIYRLRDDNDRPLGMSFFQFNTTACTAPLYVNMREVVGRHKLNPGTYVIVPTTFGPNGEADFLLRIYSEQKSECDEIDDVTELVDVPAPDEPPPDDAAADAALREAFATLAGEDLEIDAFELRDIVNAEFKKEFQFEGFCLETCRSMVALMDLDQSGKLDFDEFKNLWNDLRLWKAVFQAHDADKSGNFNSYELTEALDAVGYRVNNKIFNCLVMRYSGKEGIIEFNDFIACCVRLKTVFESFKAQEKDAASGRALFSQDEFIQTVAYV